METSQVISYVITLLALVTTLIAWITKLKWSKEFKEAKQAEIKAITAQMNAIREKAELYESVISNKLIEHSKQTIASLEELLDKTEKSRQEEIRGMLKEIKASKDAIRLKYDHDKDSSFINVVSNGIRTPLNAIVGFSNLLVDEELGKNEKEEYIKIINVSAENLLSVIADLINLLKTFPDEKTKVK